MHYRPLSAAIALALLVTLGCDKADDTPQTAQNSSETTQAAAPAAQKTIDLAYVQERIANVDKAAGISYNSILRHYPQIDSVSVITDGYTAHDHGATAITHLTIKQNSGEPIVITCNDDITFNQDLFNSGIVAKINSTLAIDDSIANLLDLDEEDKAQLQNALQYTSMVTELHTDGKHQQTFTIKPFDEENDHGKIAFEGLKLNSHFDEQHIAHFAGTEVKLEVGALTISEQQGTDGDYVPRFTIKPFTTEYSLSPNGDLKIEVSAMAFHNTEDNVNIDIGGISGDGKNYQFDDEIGTFVGEMNLSIKGIRINSDTMPAPLVLDSIDIYGNTKKDGNLYDSEGKYVFNINADSFAKLSNMHNLQVKDISLSSKLDDISVQTYHFITYEAAELAQASKTEVQQQIQSLMSDIAANKTGISTDIAVHTEQGDATFVGNLKAKANANTDVDTWKAAFSANDPSMAIKLLQQNFDFKLKITIPDSLIQATGMAAMMGMTAGYVVKEGDDYIMQLENSADGIKLNGNVIPLP